MKRAIGLAALTVLELPHAEQISLEVPVSRKMEPLERARRALAATAAILTGREDG